MLIYILDALILELELCPKHAVLKNECRNLQGYSLYDVSQLGTQSGSFTNWDPIVN